MDKKQIQKGLEELKKINVKRKFKQTYDLILSFKNLDMKKPEQQLDFFVALPHDKGKKTKVCALVGPEMQEQAKEACDGVIMADDFDNYAKDKKAMKKLAEEYDYFIAQANLMAKVATVFGRVFGPRGKMPNPKAGCVVPANANLKTLVGRLQKTVRIQAKTTPMTQLAVGKEDSDEQMIIDNIYALYDSIVHHLPSGINNLKHVYLKLTMSKPIKLE